MRNIVQKYENFLIRFWVLLPISYIVGSGISFGKFRLYHFFLIFFLLGIVQFYKKIKLEKIDFFFLAFCLWETATFFWAQNKILSLHYLFCFYNGVLLLMSCNIYSQTTEFNFQKILRTIFIFNIFIMVLGSLEMLSIFHWPKNYYTEAFYGQNIPYLLKKYGCDLRALEYFKTVPAVFFWNANDLTFYLMSTLPLVFLIKLKREWLRFIYFFAVIALLYANPSRACFFGLLLSLPLAFIFVARSKLQKVLIAAIMFTIVLSILSAQQLFFLGSIRQNRLSTVAGSFIQYSGLNSSDTLKAIESNKVVLKQLQVNHSTDTRVSFLEQAKKRFLTNPLFGVGAGNLLVLKEGNVLTNVHNYWFEILTETGIVGATFFALWIFSMLGSAYEKRVDFYVFSLSFIIMLPSALAVSTAVYQPGFWIPVALLYLYLKIKKPLIE